MPALPSVLLLLSTVWAGSMVRAASVSTVSHDLEARQPRRHHKAARMRVQTNLTRCVNVATAACGPVYVTHALSLARSIAHSATPCAVIWLFVDTDVVRMAAEKRTIKANTTFVLSDTVVVHWRRTVLKEAYSRSRFKCAMIKTNLPWEWPKKTRPARIVWLDSDTRVVPAANLNALVDVLNASPTAWAAFAPESIVACKNWYHEHSYVKFVWPTAINSGDCPPPA